MLPTPVLLLFMVAGAAAAAVPAEDWQQCGVTKQSIQCVQGSSCIQRSSSCWQCVPQALAKFPWPFPASQGMNSSARSANSFTRTVLQVRQVPQPNTHAVRLTAAPTSAEAMQEAPAKAAAPVLAKSSSAPTAAAAQPSSGSATGGKTSAAAVPAPASNSSGLAPVTAAPAMLPATVSRPTEPAAADAEPAAGNMANAVLPRKYGIPVVQDPPYTLKSAVSGAKTSCRAAATALLSSMTVAPMVVF